MDEQGEDDRLADGLLREERHRRRRTEDVGDQGELVRCLIRGLDEPRERLRRRGDGEHAARDRVHRVQAVVEARHDAEVAAAAADRPEQVGLVRLVDVDDAPVGRHDFGSEHMVDRQPVLAHEVAGAAAEREPPDPDGRGVAEADRKAVCRGRGRDVARGEAAGGANDTPIRVDLEGGELAQVEHDASLSGAVARIAVTSRPHCELDAGLARQGDDVTHLARVGGTDDRRRAMVDRAQHHGAGGVVVRVVGADHRAFELCAKVVDRKLGGGVHRELLRSLLRPSIVATLEASARTALRCSDVRLSALLAFRPAARGRRRVDAAPFTLVRFDHIRARQRAGADHQRGARAQEGRARASHRRGLRRGAGRRAAHDHPRRFRPVRRHRSVEQSGLAGLGKFVMEALRASVEHAQRRTRKPRSQRRAPAKKRSSAA